MDCSFPEVKKSEDGLILSLSMPSGCESLNIGLFRHEGNARDLWEGNAFTKTQYAEDFVKAHLLVITILDYCKEVDILREVHDEGHYWETRDLKVLGENINESSQMLLDLRKFFEKVKEKRPGVAITGGAIDGPVNIVEVREKEEKDAKGKNKFQK